MADILDHLTDDEFKNLSATKSEAEWNAECTRIKAARGGYYPRDWYARMIVSGIAGAIAKGWVVPGDMEIKLSHL